MERIDDLHRNGYRLIQSTEHFCFGCDAVLLSGFARVKKDETVLDLGTGTGVIPILLTAKTKGKHYTGLELQPEMAEMASSSVLLNGLEDKIDIICGDIKDMKTLFKPSSIDVITANPPYMNGGIKNSFDSKAIARHEIAVSLKDIAEGGAYVLKPGGRFYMIHKPHRLCEIISLFTAHGLEVKTLRLVQPFIDKEPTMVMLEAVKGGKPMVKVLPVLVIYKKQGIYTDEVYDIYYN